MIKWLHLILCVKPQGEPNCAQPLCAAENTKLSFLGMSKTSPNIHSYMEVFMEYISDPGDITISSVGTSCEIKIYNAFYFAINTKSVKLVSYFLNSVYKHILFLTAKYGLLCASSY